MSEREICYSGVIEGFYGRPWSPQQRSRMLQWLKEFGLNTYFYAPKDDLKQRAFWREPYDTDELTEIKRLASLGSEQGIRFIVGLSPGLDIRFADPSDRELVIGRLQQLLDVGVDGFALLFDDLPGQLTSGDAHQFGSLAKAQSSIANDVYHWLYEQVAQPRLLFCPTPYCGRMEKNELGGANYLADLGAALHSSIDIFWTGPEIVSRLIPRESIEQLTAKLRRQPVIWDNLHANDYDGRRLFCGPYNRDSSLKNAVKGILLNPNNEFPINYVPLRTLGQYLHRDDYDSCRAYLDGLRDWCDQYVLYHPRDGMTRVPVEDLRLLADCYYLPHEEGDEANRLKVCVETLLQKDVLAWNDELAIFRDYHRRIVNMFEWLTELADRELFYAWSRRVWELREEMDLISQLLHAKQQGSLDGAEAGFCSETHLPGTYRGGMVAVLQRHFIANERITMAKR